jgi:hypothetical protein
MSCSPTPLDDAICNGTLINLMKELADELSDHYRFELILNVPCLTSLPQKFAFFGFWVGDQIRLRHAFEGEFSRSDSGIGGATILNVIHHISVMASDPNMDAEIKRRLLWSWNEHNK